MQPRDILAEKILNLGQNNKPLSSETTQAFLKAAFDSSRVHGLFESFFDIRLYRKALSFYKPNTFKHERPLYGVLGITRVLEDVNISQRNHSQYRDLQRFIEEDFCQFRDHTYTIRKFGLYFTARINFKMMSTEGDFQILSISDNNADVIKPAWLQRNGAGYNIFSIKGSVEIVVKASVSEKILLTLSGKRVINSEDESKNIPYWIDFTRLIIDGNTIFDNLTSACYDKPYTYTFDVKADEEVKIQVEWLPHRSDT